MDLNLFNTGLYQLKSKNNLWVHRLRGDVRAWCVDHLDGPVELIVTQEVYGLSILTTVVARFQNEIEAFHFKTRWWGK